MLSHIINCKIYCFIVLESAQDIFSAGITLLSLVIGRKRVFQALSPEAQLCEMTFFYGTRPMENLGIAFAKILRFILLKHSQCIRIFIMFAGGLHVTENMRFGFSNEPMNLRLFCERYVESNNCHI